MALYQSGTKQKLRVYILPEERFFFTTIILNPKNDNDTWGSGMLK